MLMDQAAF